MVGLSLSATVETVTLKVLSNNWIQGALDEAFAIFQRENPGIKVEPELMPYAPLLEAIEIRLKSKSGEPDVLSVDVPLVASYGIRGYLLPLNKYFTRKEESVWMDAAKESAYFKTILLAPPGRTSSQLLYYNKDLFAQAGLGPLPNSPEKRLTWEEVAELAKKLVKRGSDGRTEVWGLLFGQINRPYQLLPLPQSLGGGSGFSRDGLRVKGYLTNDAWLKAFTFYRDLFNTWNVAPRGTLSEATDEIFASGRCGMFVQGEWALAALKTRKLNWGTSYFPYFKDGKPATPTGSWHWGVNKYTKHPEQAARLVKFLTTDPRVARGMFMTAARLPAQKSLFALTDSEITALGFPVDSVHAIFYELQKTAVGRPKSPGYLEWENILTTAIEDIRNGADVKQSLGMAEDRIEALIAKYR